MASTDPLFNFSLKRWPPIFRYKREASQESLACDIVDSTAAALPTADHPQSNLVAGQPNQAVAREQALPPALSSSSEDLSVPLMNPNSITFPYPLPDLIPPLAPLEPTSPTPFLGTLQHHIGQQPPSSTPSPIQLGDTYQQFGVTPNYPQNNISFSGGLPSMSSLPSALWFPLQSTPISAMGGSIGAATRGVGDFPPLHSLPPSFWEPVVRQPEPEPTPPMHTPQSPTLENLAGRPDGKGENFSDDSLKAIIIKAQPHHSNQTLAHLNREQLIKHVDDLVAWWKQTHPQQIPRPRTANVIPVQPVQQQQQQQQTIVQIRQPQRPQSAGLPPLSPAVQASAASAGAAARAQEKVIGQCPCCCDAQQNAAFSPCGHLYACTRCAHRLYDGGRGKCPVCRVPIQTYLKIYATG